MPASAARSQENFTSCAVNGVPSCHLTPLTRWKVTTVPSGLTSHDLGEGAEDLARAVEAHQALVQVVAQGGGDRRGGIGGRVQRGWLLDDADDGLGLARDDRDRGCRRAGRGGCGTGGRARRGDGRRGRTGRGRHWPGLPTARPPPRGLSPRPAAWRRGRQSAATSARRPSTDCTPPEPTRRAAVRDRARPCGARGRGA